jgi:hypothetical protein
MSSIPLDLQRKLEKRWAGRFSRPAGPAEKPSGVNSRTDPRQRGPVPDSKPEGKTPTPRGTEGSGAKSSAA